VEWPEFCFEKRDDVEEHIFVIGDWGGIFRGAGLAPEPAWDNKRPKVPIIDDRAQIAVAEQMERRANASRPRYILNVGDNFYWGGINADCGAETYTVLESVLPQWDAVFESIYKGPALAGLPWMGVLGNHDYGGYMFTKGWDQAIAYTWGETGRWLTPALYWSTKVHYSDFSVDYLFVDSNVNDAFAPQDQPSHNMCSERNNPPDPTCGSDTGPVSAWDCTMWFMRLWQDQLAWMPKRLEKATGDWRIIVTHFPPEFHREDWSKIAREYSVDLFVTGHRHQQEVSNRDQQMGGAAWIVSGGGGGIVSEGTPTADGNDDQYGFFDLTITRDQIKIEAITHTGILRSTTIVQSSRTTTSSGTGTATATTTPAVTTATTTTTDRQRGRARRYLPRSREEDIPVMSAATGRGRLLHSGAGFTRAGIVWAAALAFAVSGLAWGAQG